MNVHCVKLFILYSCPLSSNLKKPHLQPLNKVIGRNIKFAGRIKHSEEINNANTHSAKVSN